MSNPNSLPTSGSPQSCPFHYGDILSVTTGMLLSPRHIEGVYDILNFLTGDNLFTHQLPRACEVAGPYLLDRYPDSLVIVTGLAHEAQRALGDRWNADCQNWLIGFCSQRGEYFEIEPMPSGRWLSINPIDELAAMVGEEKIIIVVEMPEKGQAGV